MSGGQPVMQKHMAEAVPTPPAKNIIGFKCSTSHIDPTKDMPSEQCRTY